MTWHELFIALVFLATPALSHAQMHGGVDFKLDAEYEKNRDPELAHDLADVSLVGLSIDAYGGGTKGGLAMHVDSHFGAGLQGGFAYRFALHPLGFALHDPNHWLTLACTTGFLLQGVTEHQGFGFLVPVRATLIIDMGDHLHLQGVLANDLAISDRREQGSQSAFFGDEFRAGLSARLGSSGSHGHGRRSHSFGKGYFVGVSMAERLGARFWGISVGHGVNMFGTN